MGESTPLFEVVCSKCENVTFDVREVNAFNNQQQAQWYAGYHAGTTHPTAQFQESGVKEISDDKRETLEELVETAPDDVVAEVEDHSLVDQARHVRAFYREELAEKVREAKEMDEEEAWELQKQLNPDLDFHSEIEESITGGYITKTPGVLGGKARLKNRRISVADIVEHLQSGETVPETAERLGMETEEVQAAYNYWREHPEEIAEQLKSRDQLYFELVSNSRASSDSQYYWREYVNQQMVGAEDALEEAIHAAEDERLRGELLGTYRSLIGTTYRYFDDFGSDCAEWGDNAVDPREKRQNEEDDSE